MPGEIKSSNEFYDYEAKYVSDSSYTTIPGDLPENIVKTIKSYALKIFDKLNLKGYARIDFFYDEEKEEIYINEVNTIPGFTSISMYPKLVEASGMDFSVLLDNLIEKVKITND